MTNEKEILCSMVLQRVLALNISLQNELVDAMGSASEVYDNRTHLGDILPEATPYLLKTLREMDQHMSRAEQEMEWATKNHIQCLVRSDESYPARLRPCTDSPILLFFRGHADLNTLRIISVVGTRHCTEYGKMMCERLLADLALAHPDLLVLSGLAYGVDINAHRAAMKNGLPTVGILAHGLDQIYPRPHRNDAIEMMRHGGLLTEFMSGSTAEKVNFVRRNRIVAGMADATLVVESKERGGSLITAGLTTDYGRRLFAVPGRVGDEMSVGCNNLIREQKATMITSANDLLTAMEWQTAPQQRPVQMTLFPEYTPDEKKIVDCLKANDSVDLSMLSMETGMPVHRLTSILFDMDMKGIVKTLNGGRYQLTINN